RAPDPRAGAAIIERPRPPFRLPGGCKQHLAIGRLHGDIDRAGVIVDVQRLAPGLAAVGGHEYAAIRARTPLQAEHRNHDVIGVMWIDDDAADLADVLEAHEIPGLARIRREIDTRAGDHVVADVGLAGAHPDQVRVRGGNGDRANGARRLLLENRLEVQAAIGRLEHTAAGRADIVDLRVAGNSHLSAPATT